MLIGDSRYRESGLVQYLICDMISQRINLPAGVALGTANVGLRCARRLDAS